MKNVLMLSAVVLLVCGSALAAPLVVNNTQNIMIDSFGSPGPANQGADVSCGGRGSDRFANNNNYIVLSEFGPASGVQTLNPSGTVYNWLVANGVTPTAGGVQAAIIGGQISVQFGVYDSAPSGTVESMQLRTAMCSVDWTQSNGTERDNNDHSSWTLPTNGSGVPIGATYTNPNQQNVNAAYPLAVEQGQGWGINQLQRFNSTDDYVASAADITAMPSVAGYLLWTLTAQAASDAMFNPDSVGFYPWKTGGNGANDSMNMLSSGLATAPELVFTNLQVPEPATMSLLVLGAFGLIGAKMRRRKTA